MKGTMNSVREDVTCYFLVHEDFENYKDDSLLSVTHAFWLIHRY